MGTLDFFLLEGGEYLERLDALSQAQAGTFQQGDELLRLARAFRGSAIMASQHGMARTGQGLEAVARAVREGRLGWTVATRGELIRAIDDAKILMRRLRTPEQGDTEKAEAIGVALDRLSGRASAQMRAQAGVGLDAGGRAFVAREAASIASVLQHAARTLRGDPANRDVLVGIAPAMSALRGVAIINDLPPLGEILSAIEHAARDVLAAAGTMGADAADVFEAGARALARAAREVVDSGRPDAEAEESHAFAARLFTALTGAGVVSIESLYFDDDGPHIVRRGEPPATPGAGLARVEMVSHGEYLNAAAAELARVETPVQRDLRLYAIAASVRPMMGSTGSPLARALGRLAEGAREAIGRGAASRTVEEFIARIRDAAAALTSAQSVDDQKLGDRIETVAAGLASLTRTMATRAVPAYRQEEEVKRASEEARASKTPAVPEPPVPPATSQQPTATVLGDADFATSFMTLEQLLGERGMPAGSLDELLAGITPTRTTDPRNASAMSRGQPPAPPQPSQASQSPPEADVVPIESLVYRGEAALQRALSLKAEILAAQKDEARLNALLREVFDLVELGLGSGR